MVFCSLQALCQLETLIFLVCISREKSYSIWEFQFRIFVMGKELLDHIDGSDLAPTKPTKLAQWQVKDARVMSWILMTS